MVVPNLMYSDFRTMKRHCTVHPLEGTLNAFSVSWNRVLRLIVKVSITVSKTLIMTINIIYQEIFKIKMDRLHFT